MGVRRTSKAADLLNRKAGVFLYPPHLPEGFNSLQPLVRHRYMTEKHACIHPSICTYLHSTVHACLHECMHMHICSCAMHAKAKLACHLPYARMAVFCLVGVCILLFIACLAVDSSEFVLRLTWSV